MVSVRSAIALPILFGSAPNRATVTHFMSHSMEGGVVSKKLVHKNWGSQ